jgi:biotin carboxyl carrier protein
MFTCVYCGWQASNELARVCIDCGPEKNWSLNQIDLPESIITYQRSMRELFFAGASEEEISRFSLQLRERLKISFSFDQLFNPILKKERQRADQIGQFKIEFDENVAEAYAGHDTYLRFRLTNLSDTNFLSFNLDWDDPETPDELDLHIHSRQPIKPGKSIEIGGSHIFARMGIKDISDLQITVTNQFQDSAVFRAESFTFKVSNPDQRVTNLTHNQISIEGRGVIDASGMGAQSNSVSNDESWRELEFNYLADKNLPTNIEEELQRAFENLIESRREKEEQARQEAARLERERQEKEEQARQEAVRLERERQEKEEQARQEAARLERERQEKEEQERLVAARLEWELRQKEEQERQEAARLEWKRIEKEQEERQEAARLERERHEKEEKERQEAAMLRLQHEARLEREREEKRLAAKAATEEKALTGAKLSSEIETGKSSGELVEVRVPDIGDYKDATVIELLVKSGDTIKAEQSIITIDFPDLMMEVPSTAGGIVKELKVKLGEKVSEGSLIATLETNVLDEPASGEKGAAEEAARARAYQEQKQKEKEANWKKLRESDDSSSKTQPSGARRSNVSNDQVTDLFNPVIQNNASESNQNWMWWGVFGLVALIWGIVKFGITPPQSELPSNPPATVSSDTPGTGGEDIEAVNLPWNGGVYTGTVSADGVPHGKGVLDWSRTCTDNCWLSYRGRFEYGECRGKGTLRITGGDKFVGQFTSCGTAEGTYTFANGYKQYNRLVNHEWK